MAKDVNLHLKVTGAEQTKQQLEQTGQAAKDVGQKTAEGQKQAAPAIDNTTQKLGVMGHLFKTLKSQVIGFFSAFLGIHAVVKLVTFLIEKLERVAELQKDIYDKSLQFAEMGQALEFQAGTIGKQQFWAEQAIAVQKAGALQTPEVAQQMLVSMDIAFADLGGIKDKAIRDLAKQLAPFIGAAGLGPEEVSKVFEFAGTAGIEPTAEAYKDYFAKLRAGYTASKAVDFGQFMMGLQKGGTAYMSMGGTLTEAISAFSAARAVTANESLAANMVEQIARLSGGGYEKPRAAIEKALSVKWPQMGMDQRTEALLQYVGRIPEAERAQTLAEQGFPVELTTQIGKMVSPEAIRTMESTRREVTDATAGMIDDMTRSYIDSILGQARQLEGTVAGRIATRGPEFAIWQRRIAEAQSKFKDQAAIGQDRWIKDSLEPYVIALEEMEQQLRTPEGKIPKSGPRRRLWFDIQKELDLMRDWPQIVYPAGQAAKKGYELSRRFDAELRLQESAPMPPIVPPPSELSPQSQAAPVGPVSYNYDHRVIHQTIFNPVVGMNKQDLRIEPPYLG